MSETWIGVDPGARWTGIVAREGMTILGYRIIDRAVLEPEATEPGPRTMEAICEAISQVADPATSMIAIERASAPNPHMKLKDGSPRVTSVVDILSAREVVGWVRCVYPAAVLVKPAGHGVQSAASYPAELFSVRELAWIDAHNAILRPARKGSVLQHARSAYDVAGTAAREHRLRLALVTQRAHH